MSHSSVSLTCSKLINEAVAVSDMWIHCLLRHIWCSWPQHHVGYVKNIYYSIVENNCRQMYLQTKYVIVVICRSSICMDIQRFLSCDTSENKSKLIITGPLKVAGNHIHQRSLPELYRNSQRWRIGCRCCRWRSHGWPATFPCLVTQFIKQTNLKPGIDFRVSWGQRSFPYCGTFAAVIPVSPALPPPEVVLKEVGTPALIRKRISKAPCQEQ